jgi:ribokinase
VPRIVVVGSVNQDVTSRVPHHPAPGETVLGTDVVRGLGGKGANQAVAAARLGASVELVAALGDDEAGRSLADRLAAEGVGTGRVGTVAGSPTGVALIAVDAAGQNTIVVAPGANRRLLPEHLAAASEGLGDVAVVVAQNELTPETVAAAAGLAKDAGARFVLNWAPFGPLPADVVAAADPLVVNAVEAAHALDVDLAPGTAPGATGDGTDPGADGDAGRLAVALERRYGLRSVVVTLGGAGAVAWAEGALHRVEAPAVTAVDTTGAGDAFVGALAAALAAGAPLVQAVRQGVRAASYSVTRPGTTASFASAADLAGAR